MAISEPVTGYRFGSFVLDLEWGGLFAEDGKEMPLRPKSFALLRMLVENAGRIISHETIMGTLWPDLFVTENNVTQCIHEIRRVLGADASRTLQTLPRRGYRFTPGVTSIPPRESRLHRHGDRPGVGVEDRANSSDPQLAQPTAETHFDVVARRITRMLFLKIINDDGQDLAAH